MIKKLLFILVILAIAVSVSAANLKWDGVGRVVGYNVYYTDGTDNFNYDAKERPEVLDIDNTLNLQAGKTYIFHVTAYNNFSESGPSNTAEYITTAIYTPPVDNLPIKIIVPNTVTITITK